MYIVNIKSYKGQIKENKVDAETYSIEDNVVTFYNKYKFVKAYSLHNIVSFEKVNNE